VLAALSIEEFVRANLEVFDGDLRRVKGDLYFDLEEAELRLVLGEADVLAALSPSLLEGERRGLLDRDRRGLLEGERRGLLDRDRRGLLEGERQGLLDRDRRGLLEGERDFLRDESRPLCDFPVREEVDVLGEG